MERSAWTETTTEDSGPSDVVAIVALVGMTTLESEPSAFLAATSMRRDWEGDEG